MHLNGEPGVYMGAPDYSQLTPGTVGVSAAYLALILSELVTYDCLGFIKARPSTVRSWAGAIAVVAQAGYEPPHATAGGDGGHRSQAVGQGVLRVWLLVWLMICGWIPAWGCPCALPVQAGASQSKRLLIALYRLI